MGGKVSSLVFQPPAKPSHINSTKYILLPTAKGNMIPAFYFDRSAHLTILVSHGNAEDLGAFCVGLGLNAPSNQGSGVSSVSVQSHGEQPPGPTTAAFPQTAGMIYDQFFDFSRQLNVNVMAYEYSGYGKASGAPSEENCYADIDAAFKYLVEVRALCFFSGFGWIKNTSRRLIHWRASHSPVPHTNTMPKSDQEGGPEAHRPLRPLHRQRALLLPRRAPLPRRHARGGAHPAGELLS